MQRQHFSLKKQQIGHFVHCSSKVKSATHSYFCINVTSSIEPYCVSFGKINCDPFFQNKVFYARGKSQKSAFSIEYHYNVGLKMMQNDNFEVRYLENDNGDPPFFITFSDRGRKNLQYREG